MKSPVVEILPDQPCALRAGVDNSRGSLKEEERKLSLVTFILLLFFSIKPTKSKGPLILLTHIQLNNLGCN